MAVNGSSETTLTGRVVSVNEKGIKFEGAGEWLNASKFAVGLVMPERGQTVTVTVDRQGFMRSCMAADGAAVDAAAPRSQNGSGVQKDRTITRLAVLKAAAEYAASKPQSKSSEVLAIAASWERWVLRDDDPTTDNVDAF